MPVELRVDPEMQIPLGEVRLSVTATGEHEDVGFRCSWCVDNTQFTKQYGKAIGDHLRCC